VALQWARPVLVPVLLAILIRCGAPAAVDGAAGYALRAHAHVLCTSPWTMGSSAIGLALARRLAEMHGGDIAAHSDGPGQGSTFTITMPVCESFGPRASCRQPDAPRVACRVLSIDDNRDAANTMAMLDDELGGASRIAHDAGSGLEIIQAYQPDIVVLDIGMPGIDGYEACRRMRQRPSPKAMVMVAVTGWGQPQDKQRAPEAGFDAHLTKPVDLEALARILAASPPRHGT
jgi:CheY-like chemotaxis protein